MSRILPYLLTIVTAGLTAIAAAYVVTGPGLALEMMIVSGLAFIAWRAVPLDETAVPHAVVPYLGIVIISLLLAAAQFWSGFAAHLEEEVPALFSVSYGSPEVVWFLACVTAPITLMLVGGYFFVRNHSLGHYLAWWTVVFAVTSALVQMGVEFGTGAYEHHYYLGTLAAVVELGLGIVGWMRLVDRRIQRPVPIQAEDRRGTILWTLLFLAFGLVYGVTLFTEAGLLPVGVIVGSMVGGIIAWRRTTARVPADPMKLLPLYLLMLGLFYFHVGEETLTGFNQAIAAITGTPWGTPEFTYFIALIGPAIWVAGGISLWLRQPFGNFILWFMIIGMILGEPTHLIVFPVIAMFKYGIGYTYFSGMFTALFPMVPAILAAIAIVNDSRAQRTVGAT